MEHGIANQIHHHKIIIMQTRTIELSTGVKTTIKKNGSIAVEMPGTENRSSKFKFLVDLWNK